MIRPFTCLCVLLAAGSGLYLYQTKHRTLMLDQQIAEVLKQADAARARTAVLRAEHAALSQSQRVGDLATRFLSLRPTVPGQFVQLASLDDHLPPVEHFPTPAELAAAPPAPAEANMDHDADLAPIAPMVQDTLPTAPATPAVQFAAATPPRPMRKTTLARTQYATAMRPEAMPLAASRPVASAVLATAALHQVGTARTRITNAEAYTPHPALPYQGSMLGQSAALNLAPPVPVAN